MLMDSVATFIGKYLIIVPVLAMAYLLYKTRDKQHLLIILIGGGILSLVLAEVGRHLYWDPRPFIKDGVTPLFSASRDNGFPSDHTLLSAFLAFVALLYSKKIGGGLLLVAALIGWARVFAGVHHAVDIIASFLITGVAVITVDQLLKRYYHAEQHSRKVPK